MKQNSIIITVVVAVLVGAVAFFGGMQYEKGQRGQFGGTGRGGFGARAGGLAGAAAGANRPVNGSIISADDKSITVQLADGSSKIVLLSGGTAITEATAASAQALQTGKRVMVFGTTNSDGSVTAQNIQLNPQMRGGANGSGAPRPQ